MNTNMTLRETTQIGYSNTTGRRRRRGDEAFFSLNVVSFEYKMSTIFDKSH